MISAVNGRKRALLTKSALEWHNKRCTAQSTLCVGNKKGKTELKAMCDFKKKKKKLFFFFFFFSIAILGSRYDTRIAGPSIAMHRCIDASLRPYRLVLQKWKIKRTCQHSQIYVLFFFLNILNLSLRQANCKLVQSTQFGVINIGFFQTRVIPCQLNQWLPGVRLQYCPKNSQNYFG